jgi:HEAT repeat protein
MPHVFVSYCHSDPDADFAHILDAEVRKAGFTTWRDLNLNAGENWREGIDDGIKDAMAVIVIMSPNSRVSPYVNFEWAFAMGCGVPVVPVLFKLSAADLHPRLSSVQWRDFSNNLSLPWETLAQDLRVIADAEREFTVRVPRDAPPVMREAAAALDSMERDRRRAAIASLGQMDHPVAIELLAQALHHPIQEVRFGAAAELGEKHHDLRALPTLLEALQCGDEAVKPWMISRIGHAAVPALIEALKKRQLERSDVILDILGEIGGIEAVQALTEYLRDPDPAMRRSAAFALSAAQDPSAFPALREAKSDPDVEVRRGVASAIAKCGGAGAVEDLLALLHDSEGDVRHQAVCGLDDICALKPVPAALEPAISRVIDALIGALVDQNAQVSMYAGRVLQHLADPRAVPGLVAVLGGEGPPIRVAWDVLEAIGKAAIPALREATKDPNQRLRLRAIKFVSRFGDDTDASLVAEALRDTNPDVRLLAIEAIGYGLQQSPLILEALIERLHDPEEDICIAAIVALGKSGKVSAAPHLIECLKIEALAPSAAKALEAFDMREVRTALKAWNRNKKE